VGGDTRRQSREEHQDHPVSRVSVGLECGDEHHRADKCQLQSHTVDRVEGAKVSCAADEKQTRPKKLGAAAIPKPRQTRASRRPAAA